MNKVIFILFLPCFVQAQKTVYKDTLSIEIILQKKDGSKLPTQNIWKISFKDSNTVIVRNKDSTKDFYYYRDAEIKKDTIDSVVYRFIPLYVPAMLQTYLDNGNQTQVKFIITYKSDTLSNAQPDIQYLLKGLLQEGTATNGFLIKSDTKRYIMGTDSYIIGTDSHIINNQK